MAQSGGFSVQEPFRRATAVTKSDATTYAPPIDALYVGTAGDVAVRGLDGTNFTMVACLAGTIYNVTCDRVLATGTTAANIVALYR